jgi:hypothetical protein
MTDTRTPYTTTAEPNVLLERLSEQERQEEICYLRTLLNGINLQKAGLEKQAEGLRERLKYLTVDKS